MIVIYFICVFSTFAINLWFDFTVLTHDEDKLWVKNKPKFWQAYRVFLKDQLKIPMFWALLLVFPTILAYWVGKRGHTLSVNKRWKKWKNTTALASELNVVSVHYIFDRGMYLMVEFVGGLVVKTTSKTFITQYLQYNETNYTPLERRALREFEANFANFVPHHLLNTHTPAEWETIVSPRMRLAYRNALKRHNIDARMLYTRWGLFHRLSGIVETPSEQYFEEVKRGDS